MEVRDKTRDPVQERLLELARDGAPLPARALPRDLYRQILAAFGSIANARRAAGIAEAVPRRRRWSDAAVLGELQRLRRAGVEIKERDLNDAGHSGVVAAARIHFGSLIRARRLAGIAAPRRVAREREPWDADRVVEEIQARRAGGETLASSKVPPPLRLAAIRYHGTWQAAIETAGICYDEVRLHAASEPDEVLLERLRALARVDPWMTARQLDEHQLGYLLRRRFPSLSEAVRAAGLEGWPLRRRLELRTMDATLDAIRARRAGGHPLARSAVLREDRNLLRSAERHFGTWRRALRAAAAPDHGPATWPRAPATTPPAAPRQAPAKAAQAR
jgi:hypothetical protein